MRCGTSIAQFLVSSRLTSKNFSYQYRANLVPHFTCARSKRVINLSGRDLSYFNDVVFSTSEGPKIWIMGCDCCTLFSQVF